MKSRTFNGDLRSAVGGTQRFARTVAITLVLFCGMHVRAEQPTAAFLLPPDARGFDAGGGMLHVNGLPTRIHGFISNEKPEQVRAWYRQRLGQPLVENRLGSRMLLGKAMGSDFVTVQLEPDGDGTRGVIASAALLQAEQAHKVEAAAAERWQSRLPVGSRVLSRIVSGDAGKTAVHVVFVNHHGEELNRDRVTHLMQEDGLAPDRRASGKGASAAGASTSEGGQAMTHHYVGRGAEGYASILRTTAGQTAVVLNIITDQGRTQ